MAAVKKPATYADIEALPEHLTGEILDGELYVWPRPRPRHAVAESVIVTELLGPYQMGRRGPGGWWILGEPEVHLGKHVLVPDVAGWRRERLPEIPDRIGIDVAPDWVCEILSPTTAKIDRKKKLRIYAAQGVDHLWLVDPLLRTVEVYRRSGRNWEMSDVFSDDDRMRVEPFDAIELELSQWWVGSPPKGAAEDGPVWPTATGSP